MEADNFETLLKIVKKMVNESGDPLNFNPQEWLENWLRQPVPALGNVLPITLLETTEGRKQVETILRMMQSGSYA